MSLARRPGVWAFLILLGTYAYYWQSRDWGGASRLILAYSLVDRGTVSIDGLERQTGDRARFAGHSYSDKLPGFSILATIPYAFVRVVLRIPPEPLNGPALPYWPADYWVTLATSGLLTALTGVLLVGFARDLGCGPRRSLLIALAYGLATPAYPYATMCFGHQATAFALLASFVLIGRTSSRRPALCAGLAGFLAAYAAVIELQVGPVSAILGLYLLTLVATGARKASDVGNFAVGAIVPTLLLLLYNVLAFGSPWDMGYFHHAEKQFAQVHSAENPLGLRGPDLSVAVALLWGRFRGLLFYAPIVALVPLGLMVLIRRRLWGVAAVSTTAMAAVYLVNLSYPEWTGGWSTGPRLLTPLLPFAMLQVAALLGAKHMARTATVVATALAVSGTVLMSLFVAAGGRFPTEFDDPLVQAVWPIWRGQLVPAWTKEPFARNPVVLLAPGFVGRLTLPMKWVQFLPLFGAQAIAITTAMFAITTRPGSIRAGDPGIDRQENSGRDQQEPENPAEKASGVNPDPSPGFVS